jgi:hypothetical protein
MGIYLSSGSLWMSFKIEPQFKPPKNVDFSISVFWAEKVLISSQSMIRENNDFLLKKFNIYRIVDDFYNPQKMTVEIKQVIKEVPSSDKVSIKPPKSSPKLSSMLDNPQFSDFKFVINDREFDVHKCVLATASDAFVKIFKVNSNFWKINDISEGIFLHLLRFIYTEQIPKNLNEIAIKLYEAASVFKMVELMEICSESIHKTLSTKNCLEIYNWAYLYDLEVLKMKSWELVKR